MNALNALPNPLLSLSYRVAAVLARIAAASPRTQPLGAEELRGMSELGLKDLGIGRSEVPHVLEDGTRC